MEKNHRPSGGEIGQQGHGFSGLGSASLCGRENLLGRSVAARRCGIDFGGLGRLSGSRRTNPSFSFEKALSSVESGKDEPSRQYTTKRLAQIEAAEAAALVTMPTTTWGAVLKEGARLTKQSEQNLHTLLHGSTYLDDVARALNMLDVDTQEGTIKAAVKPVVHSFIDNRGT